MTTVLLLVLPLVMIFGGLIFAMHPGFTDYSDKDK